ncbi:SH3 domain-containing protein [Coprinopsis sp. MPI-PUGE-AT-0042]|nr:SH3 domain-containing protein [Coprinopsis sp. MPI-PUGE-AT-0042]
MTAEQALVNHLLSQIEQNVNFLASQNHISQDDAAAILARLPADGSRASNPSSISQLSNKFSNMMGSVRGAPPAAPRAVPTPPAAKIQQARALWGYNEDGSDPNDLIFSAGDIIDIVEETNADWWKGRFNGREGLVPANYMEKLAVPMPSVSPPVGTKPYKPFRSAYHGVDTPPAAPAPVQAPPTNSLGLQEHPDNEKKAKGFGKYKDTLAHSAVGGAGFGAGAAIGGGLVRAIF